MSPKIAFSIHLQYWEGTGAGGGQWDYPELPSKCVLQSLLNTKDTDKHLGTLIYLSQGSSVDMGPEFENEAYHISKHK